MDVLVVDETGSHPTEPLNPKIVDGLKQAQADKHVLKLVGVPGKDAAAPVRTVVLDPAPDNDSVDAQNERAAALACAEWLAADAPDLQPTTPGSDVLTAVQTAARQIPKTLWVNSDGVATAGALDLARVGFDEPDAVVDALVTGKELPDLTGVTVIWTGLGEVTGGMKQSARTGTETLWTAILHRAGVSDPQFDNGVGDTGPAAVNPALPQDPMPTFPVHADSRPDAVCVSVPSDTFFLPDSAVPDSGAAQSMADLAQQLNAHPTWTVTVTGHTADFGAIAGQQTLSTRRAQSIADVLTGLGVPADRISVVGVGSTQPARPEWTANGHHDLAAATQNRRVEIAAAAFGTHTNCTETTQDLRGAQTS